jgi:histidyl-tRNA synthetase
VLRPPRLRLCAPVGRPPRPQKGRYRKFYQCEIDMISEPGVLAAAELIEATAQALTAVGLEETTVGPGLVAALAEAAGLSEARQDGSFILLDKLDKIGWDGGPPSWKALGSPTKRSPQRWKDRRAAGADPDKLGDARPNMTATRSRT